MSRKTMRPPRLEKGDRVLSVNGARVPAFTIAEITRWRPPTGAESWSLFRDDGRIELSVYADDRITVERA